MNTWGISGPTFLALYASLLVLTAVAVAVSRLRMNGAAATVDAEDLDDYEVAVLNGEAGLPASVALLALDRAGVVELGDRMVRELALTQDLNLDALTGDTLFDHGIGMEVTLPTGVTRTGVQATSLDLTYDGTGRRSGEAVAGSPAIALSCDAAGRLVPQGPPRSSAMPPGSSPPGPWAA